MAVNVVSNICSMHLFNSLTLLWCILPKFKIVIVELDLRFFFLLIYFTAKLSIKLHATFLLLFRMIMDQHVEKCFEAHISHLFWSGIPVCMSTIKYAYIVERVLKPRASSSFFPSVHALANVHSTYTMYIQKSGHIYKLLHTLWIRENQDGQIGPRVVVWGRRRAAVRPRTTTST